MWIHLEFEYAWGQTIAAPNHANAIYKYLGNNQFGIIFCDCSLVKFYRTHRQQDVHLYNVYSLNGQQCLNIILHYVY